MARISIHNIQAMKLRGEKIAMLTAYDYPTAKLIDSVDIPIILVGDSLGMTVLGYESTVPVTMDDMLHHTRAVVRGSQNALIVADMPFMSYQTGASDAIRNAGRFLQEAGAQAVKLEGGAPVVEIVRALVSFGIPVMGHLGLTPQSINQLGGHKVQGKTPAAAVRLMSDAAALQEAGAFAVVLECVPAALGKLVTERLSIPTIGIGAGPYCDGQVQVLSDLLGLDPDFSPRHAKQYAHLAQEIQDAVKCYQREVQAGDFPTARESFSMDETVLAELSQMAV
ncbi:MAG: 3-methyl-2-oxobutanoate hydroxymethyltransferase [Dehalococcoidia bacterium]|jgi:3-methyl-2-oxobutanoate hydroxymethyltransferase|nr:3-methyl-2-oxobutanoate hydroxymethyltransferase [Dehalococcoidia bacterium]